MRPVEISDEFLEPVLRVQEAARGWGAVAEIVSNGPVTVPVQCARAVRAWARHLGIPATSSGIVFVIQGAKGARYALLQARELNHALASAIENVRGEPAVAPPPARRGSHFLGTLPPALKPVRLSPKLLEGVLLLREFVSEWSSRACIYAASPVTVPIRCSRAVREMARRLGMPRTSSGIVFVIKNSANAKRAAEVAAQIGAMLGASPLNPAKPI